MDRLRQRLESAERALKALAKVAKIDNPTDIEWDAAIQRFGFTFEAIWKAAKQYLYDIEGLDIGSPKGVIRSCREVGIFTEKEAMTALQMVNDRNHTVHTYNEEVAELIFGRLHSEYYSLLCVWIERLHNRTTGKIN